MPDNEKPTVDQKITATNGSSISDITQIVNVYSDTENFGTSDETTVSGIVATIVYFIINAALWLGSWLPALFWTKAILYVFPAYADDPTTPISLLIVIALIILTIPWVPEKILRIKKMSLPLKFIYAWVMGFVVLLVMMVIAENTEL